MDSCRLINPILRPPKIIAIGLNYQDHLEEIRAIGREVDDPEVPMIFNKQSTSACGPFEDIHDPKVSDKLDYEGELAFVIGKKCRHVPRSEAHNVIAGYCVSNDVSVRDWQLRVPTFTIGKSFDTHCPFGPAIVTADEISDPHNLQIKTEVNQEVRQNSNTKNLIFNCFELHFSRMFMAQEKQQSTSRAQRAKRAERFRCSNAYSSGFLGRFTETAEKNTTSQEKRK